MSRGKKKNVVAPGEPGYKMSDFVRFVISLPPEDQEKMLEMLDEIESMSDEEKSDFITESMMDSWIDEAMSGDDDDEINNYPHFLPRVGVQKCTLRVTLMGIKPSIYRKFVVPSNITLRHLSELILELMGWENYHLNQFRKRDSYYLPAYQRENDMPYLFSPVQNFNQEEYTLSDVLTDKGKHIVWEYDFGDSWEHEVRLSSIGEFEEDEPRITFVKGERACPPEDCGGIWGYQELLEIREKKAAKKRLTQEERERLEWYGLDSLTDEECSPEYFNNDFAEEICADFCD